MTKRKITKQTCSYNRKLSRMALSEFYILPKEAYPWGVCLEESNLTHHNRNWTRQAMRIWNETYKRYKKKRWGSFNVVGTPDSPLFKESCQSAEYNMIRPRWSGKLQGSVLGNYKDVDPSRSSIVTEIFFRILFPPINLFLVPGSMMYKKPIYGIIRMSNKQLWTRNLFVNVMVHELGHALGIPHLKPGRTQVMLSHGFDNCEADQDICNLTFADFAEFLKPYNL